MKFYCTRLLILLFFSQAIYSQDTIKLKEYFHHLKKVDVEISGQSYSFLFDTGGGETMISPSIAKKLNKNVHGRVTGYRMSGEMITYPVCDSLTITIGQTKIFHPVAGVWDLMKILPKGFSALDGVISLHSFADKVITLDLQHNLLIIENESYARKNLSGLAALPSRFANALAGNELSIFLSVIRNGITYWFLFDSGNMGSLLLSNKVAEEWGLTTEGMAKKSRLGQISITIADRLMNTQAETSPIIYDGALNYDLLSKSVYTIDFAQRKIWMR